MNRTWKSPHRLASLLVLSVVLASCASGSRSPSPELQQQIETARTRTDHDALASYYDREAAAARVSAGVHRTMGKSYQGMVAGGRGGASMPAHCNSIVGMYDGIATEYDGLAADHRRLASTVQP